MLGKSGGPEKNAGQVRKSGKNAGYVLKSRKKVINTEEVMTKKEYTEK